MYKLNAKILITCYTNKLILYKILLYILLLIFFLVSNDRIWQLNLAIQFLFKKNIIYNHKIFDLILYRVHYSYIRFAYSRLILTRLITYQTKI